MTEVPSKIIRVIDLDKYSGLVGSGPCVVKFTASWCGPCKMIAPFYEQTAASNSTFTCVEVDIDEADDITEAENIRGIPHFKFYLSGASVPDLEFSGGQRLKLETAIQKFQALISTPLIIDSSTVIPVETPIPKDNSSGENIIVKTLIE